VELVCYTTRSPSDSCIVFSLYRLNLEVQCNQREYERLEVLDKVVEDAKTFGVGRLLDINQRTDLGGLERDVFVAHTDLELLPPILVLLWPFTVVFLHDLGFLDDALDLFDHQAAHTHLFTDQGIIAVVGIVGITGHCAATVENSKVELQELMTEASVVAGVVSHVELLVFRHGDDNRYEACEVFGGEVKV